MTNRDTILNELTGLGSTLADHSPQNFYEVPGGYFEGLADQILNKVKALEAVNAKDEINYLSPMLSNVSKEMAYTVPVGYFGGLDVKILESISDHADYQTSEEEIGSISPLLSDLRNKNPYKVPADYFENFKPGVEKEQAKVISITKRRSYKFLIAAAIIGLLAIGALLLIRSGKVDPNTDPDKWIAKNVQKKVSAEKIDEFVALAKEDDAMNPAAEQTAPIKPEEIKELMKDIPEKDIQDFLNDAVALESNSDADEITNE